MTYYLERICYMEVTLASTDVGMAELTHAALGRRGGSGRVHAAPVEAAGASAMPSAGIRGGRATAN
jgi:hypothetical protein